MGGGGWNHGKPKIVLCLEQITLTSLALTCLQVCRLKTKPYGDSNFNALQCNATRIAPRQSESETGGRADIKKWNSSDHNKETKTSEQTRMVTTKQRKPSCLYGLNSFMFRHCRQPHNILHEPNFLFSDWKQHKCKTFLGIWWKSNEKHNNNNNYPDWGFSRAFSSVVRQMPG
jgi:hypothetical protein